MLSIGFPAPPMSTVSLLIKKPLSSIVLSGCVLTKRYNPNVCLSKSLPTFGKVHASASQLDPKYRKELVIEKEKYAEELKEIMEGKHKLPEGLVAELVPKHVAVIMDGNRRWAAERGLQAIEGHIAGRETIKKIVRFCGKCGVKVLTVYAFSTENWSRPKEEVDALMEMFEMALKTEDVDEFEEIGIRVRAIGDRSTVSESLQELIAKVEERTKSNSVGQLNFAFNYSGRYDILQACKSVANKVKDGVLQPEDINQNIIQQELETKCCEFPNVDLLIRTSGEIRISNFLLWQMAYTELYFTDKLFPDFDEEDFLEALRTFQKRQRPKRMDTIGIPKHT